MNAGAAPMSDGATSSDAWPTRSTVPAGRRWAVVLLCLLVVALLVAAVALTLADRRAGNRDRLGAEAVAAAGAAATAVLDYRPATVAEDLAAAEPLLASPFLDRFRTQSREVTVPRSREGEVSSSARVAGAALASVSGERALVVVYLDRHTVGRDGIPHVLQTVVEAGLVREGEAWLLAELTPR